MGAPLRPLPTKLVIGLITTDTERLEHARRLLERRFGRVDMASPVFAFNQTHYYEDELGRDLWRIFLCFEKLIAADTLAARVDPPPSAWRTGGRRVVAAPARWRAPMPATRRS